MKFSRKMSLLVTHKSLYLSVKRLTADDKYSLLNKDNLAQPIQMQLSKKTTALSHFLIAFLESRSNSKHFEKKEVIYFSNYNLRKTSLGKCLKMLVSEDLLASNILNCLKHCLNLHSSTFNIFIDHYEWNVVGKSLS